jgi:hypothetical protein
MSSYDCVQIQSGIFSTQCEFAANLTVLTISKTTAMLSLGRGPSFYAITNLVVIISHVPILSDTREFSFILNYSFSIVLIYFS